MLPGSLVHFLSTVATICVFAASAMGQSASPTNVAFKKAVIDTVFRSEGVAVGDFNHDGKADIGAGAVWYEAPDWKMRLTGETAPEYDPLSYSHAFQTFATQEACLTLRTRVTQQIDAAQAAVPRASQGHGSTAARRARILLVCVPDDGLRRTPPVAGETQP